MSAPARNIHESNRVDDQADKTKVFVISPTSSTFLSSWQDLWNYRDLMYLFIRRDYVTRFKQTILGPLWFVLQPLLVTLVFTVIFSGLGRIPTDGIPPLLFYMSGMLLWNYFVQCFDVISNSLLSHQHLYSKVYIPRLTIPLAAIGSRLFQLAIQLASFLGFYVYFIAIEGVQFDVNPLTTLILFPLLVLLTGAFALGAGLWLASLSVKYRDLLQLSGLATQLLMYASPIIYPISRIPERWRDLLYFNPLAMPIELTRYAFFGSGTYTVEYAFSGIAITLITLFSGILVFNRTTRNFVDSI